MFAWLKYYSEQSVISGCLLFLPCANCSLIYCMVQYFYLPTPLNSQEDRSVVCYLILHCHYISVVRGVFLWKAPGEVINWRLAYLEGQQTDWQSADRSTSYQCLSVFHFLCELILWFHLHCDRIKSVVFSEILFSQLFMLQFCVFTLHWGFLSQSSPISFLTFLFSRYPSCVPVSPLHPFHLSQLFFSWLYFDCMSLPVSPQLSILFWWPLFRHCLSRFPFLALAVYYSLDVVSLAQLCKPLVKGLDFIYASTVSCEFKFELLASLIRAKDY